MSPRTNYRTQPHSIAWFATACDVLVAWLGRISHRIDMTSPSGHHRMGAWEECASMRARELRRSTVEKASGQ